MLIFVAKYNSIWLHIQSVSYHFINRQPFGEKFQETGKLQVKKHKVWTDFQILWHISEIDFSTHPHPTHPLYKWTSTIFPWVAVAWFKDMATADFLVMAARSTCAIVWSPTVHFYLKKLPEI